MLIAFKVNMTPVLHAHHSLIIRMILVLRVFAKTLASISVTTSFLSPLLSLSQDLLSEAIPILLFFEIQAEMLLSL